MFADIHNRYTEERILSASPLELIQILYDLALDRVEAARLFLRQGNTEERARAITKIQDILSQLILSLDQEQGGSRSRDLMAIYSRLQMQLLQAHAGKSDEALAQIEETFRALADNWRGVGQLLIPERVESHEKAVVAAAPAPSSPLGTYFETKSLGAGAGYEARNWSL